MSMIIPTILLSLFALGLVYLVYLLITEARQSAEKFEENRPVMSEVIETNASESVKTDRPIELKFHDERTDLESLLEDAVASEDYEMAAAIRDQLNEVKTNKK